MGDESGPPSIIRCSQLGYLIVGDFSHFLAFLFGSFVIILFNVFFLGF